MVLAFGIIKLSITFYYRRIFVTASLKGLLFDWITKAAIAIVLLWTIGQLFAFIFSWGIHISANWGSIQDWIMYCGPSDHVSSCLGPHHRCQGSAHAFARGEYCRCGGFLCRNDC